jgi:hypothetical protein
MTIQQVKGDEIKLQNNYIPVLLLLSSRYNQLFYMVRTTLLLKLLRI